VLADRQPAGFGLVQRERQVEAYRDPLAHYERRPNLWVEPIGDWGAGELRLVELPAHTEYQDNIVALWTPAAGLTAGVEARFAYRLHWGSEPRAGASARVTQTRLETGATPSRRRLLVDFELPDGLRAKMLTADVRSSSGAVTNIALASLQDRRIARLSFEIDPASNRVAELRARLLRSGEPCSEMWLYRWTA